MIRFNELGREYAELRTDIDAALSGVMESGHFILGPRVERFETDFAAYIGMPHAVGVNSGTDALYLSLLAADIGKGDEVIVPVNTELATALAVVMTGAEPVFVDCDERYLIDIEAVPAAITERTKAIIPVHLYGAACDLDRLKALAQEHGLLIIEDCAQAAGASWNGRKVGTVGDFAAFSFYPTKNLGAYGDGGLVLAESAESAAMLRALRYRGQKDRVHAAMFGVNSRLDELQAALLSVKLPHLDRWNMRRREIAAKYDALLQGAGCVLPESPRENGSVYHLYVIRVANRDAVQARLKEAGIETLVHYPLPLHRQPVFSRWAGHAFPRADAYASDILSLPIHPFLTDEEIAIIANAIRSVLA